MNKLCDEIILYKINSYLNLEDKYKLKCCNRYFYKIESKVINFHLGNLIASYIGFNYKCKEDLKILRKKKFQIIDDISYFLLNEKQLSFSRIFTQYYIPLGIIIKIYSSNIDYCKQKLKEDYIFRQAKMRDIKNKNLYKCSGIYKKYRTVYAII